MGALREAFDLLGLKGAQTHLQSGNVVCCCNDKEIGQLKNRIEAAIEKKFGFYSEVILRTQAELKAVIDANPFAKRGGIEPAKLAVTFLDARPDAKTQQAIRQIVGHPEEIHVVGREVYVYFPDGMGRSKVVPVLTRVLKDNPGTARNWNTVTKLLDLAIRLSAE